MSHAITRPFRRALSAGCVYLLIVAAASSAQTTGGLAFVGVNVVPMDSERVLTRHTVVVQGDRIISIEPADEAAVPPGARRIEADGKYLIPGLIDGHAFLLSERSASSAMLEAQLSVFVANGVTSVRDAAGSARVRDERRRLVAEDAVVPRLHVSSPELFSVPGEEMPGTRFVQTPFEAAAAVRQYRESGYDFIAVSHHNTADVYQGIVLTARGSGLPLVGRLPIGVTLQRALDAGQQISYLDGYLEALTADQPVPARGIGDRLPIDLAIAGVLEEVDEGRIEDVARATAEAAVWNVPLLASMRVALGDPPAGLQEVGLAAGRFVADDRGAPWRQPTASGGDDPLPASVRRRYVELRDRLVRELHDAGGRLLAGSGEPSWLPPYGFGLHLELAALVAAGLPPYAALAAATRGPAEFVSFRGGLRAEYAIADEGGIRFASGLGTQFDFGRIDVGLRADLVLLGANPLDDIAHTRRIEGVVLRGHWLPRDQLDDLADRAAEILGAQ